MEEGCCCRCGCRDRRRRCRRWCWHRRRLRLLQTASAAGAAAAAASTRGRASAAPARARQAAARRRAAAPGRAGRRPSCCESSPAAAGAGVQWRGRGAALGWRWWSGTPATRCCLSCPARRRRSLQRLRAPGAAPRRRTPAGRHCGAPGAPGMRSPCPPGATRARAPPLSPLLLALGGAGAWQRLVGLRCLSASPPAAGTAAAESHTSAGWLIVAALAASCLVWRPLLLKEAIFERLRAMIAIRGVTLSGIWSGYVAPHSNSRNTARTRATFPPESLLSQQRAGHGS